MGPKVIASLLSQGTERCSKPNNRYDRKHHSDVFSNCIENNIGADDLWSAFSATGVVTIKGHKHYNSLHKITLVGKKWF